MKGPNSCSVANKGCLAPAGYRAGGGGIALGTKSARAVCAECGEAVCSKCSRIKTTKGVRRRLCPYCIRKAQ